MMYTRQELEDLAERFHHPSFPGPEVLAATVLIAVLGQEPVEAVAPLRDCPAHGRQPVPELDLDNALHWAVLTPTRLLLIAAKHSTPHDLDFFRGLDAHGARSMSFARRDARLDAELANLTVPKHEQRPHGTYQVQANLTYHLTASDVHARMFDGIAEADARAFITAFTSR